MIERPPGDASPSVRHRSHPLLARHRIALAASLLLLLAALSLLIVMAFDGGEDVAQRVDDPLPAAFRGGQWTPLIRLAQLFGIVGAWYVMWPVRAAVTVFLIRCERWEALWAWVLATLICEPAVGLLKGAYERPRPPEPLQSVSGFSFPSGHAVVGAAVAIGLVIVLVSAGPRRRYLEMIAVGFAFVMALSRVYIDVHWFTDVVAGSALGAAIMIGVAAILHEVGDRLHSRRIQGERSAAK